MDDLGKVKLCRGMVNIIFVSLATSTNLYLTTFINIRYTCETDCTLFPETCISERLIMTMADAMEKEGFVKAGYK